mmetsp:Transcript_25996/g.59809  ORF Transcript_25996/g.59809 Transcript_25996/m.59809 type:complete len:440 (+) Transcript_25996:381-1700(+)
MPLRLRRRRRRPRPGRHPPLPRPRLPEAPPSGPGLPPRRQPRPEQAAPLRRAVGRRPGADDRRDPPPALGSLRADPARVPRGGGPVARPAPPGGRRLPRGAAAVHAAPHAGLSGHLRVPPGGAGRPPRRPRRIRGRRRRPPQLPAGGGAPRRIPAGVPGGRGRGRGRRPHPLRPRGGGRAHRRLRAKDGLPLRAPEAPPPPGEDVRRRARVGVLPERLPPRRPRGPSRAAELGPGPDHPRGGGAVGPAEPRGDVGALRGQQLLRGRRLRHFPRRPPSRAGSRSERAGGRRPPRVRERLQRPPVPGGGGVAAPERDPEGGRGAPAHGGLSRGAGGGGHRGRDRLGGHLVRGPGARGRAGARRGGPGGGGAERGGQPARDIGAAAVGGGLSVGLSPAARRRDRRDGWRRQPRGRTGRRVLGQSVHGRTLPSVPRRRKEGRI